ncbi:hypothetical protein BaRGS_00039056 [Batillaria attramentaria]|uniref:Uncharacterized protein n=1 Tax=Batillaria attramentaria TaxID=370345 RepID=A0ABD0J430_9CAEN
MGIAVTQGISRSLSSLRTISRGSEGQPLPMVAEGAREQGWGVEEGGGGEEAADDEDVLPDQVHFRNTASTGQAVRRRALKTFHPHTANQFPLPIYLLTYRVDYPYPAIPRPSTPIGCHGSDGDKGAAVTQLHNLMVV